MSPLLLLGWLVACDSEPLETPEAPQPSPSEPAEPAHDDHDASANPLIATASRVFAPLPEQAAAAPLSEAQVALGKALYFDPRLSKGGDTSCNSCHTLDRFGVDGAPVPEGGDRNTPTVYNAALQVSQRWDGGAADVEEQAKAHLLDPAGMAMASPEAVVAALEAVPGYTALFQAAFPEDEAPTRFENVGAALGAFQRSLLTPGVFDAFLRGDAGALNGHQQKGLQTYIDVGCASCHAGATLGGQTTMRLGALQAYETTDLGRFKVTENEADKYAFKVASLRNVAKTGPYLHDGSVASLEEVVRLMGKHQLAVELNDEQVTDIVEFLGALTSTPDADLMLPPTLPEVEAPAAEGAPE